GARRANTYFKEVKRTYKHLVAPFKQMNHTLNIGYSSAINLI
ncbi:MAG: hypothetical protein ACI9T7_000808, partial [Oleiphilaceae bacterium]